MMVYLILLTIYFRRKHYFCSTNGVGGMTRRVLCENKFLFYFKLLFSQILYYFHLQKGDNSVNS